jgi:hypothetical protein
MRPVRRTTRAAMAGSLAGPATPGRTMTDPAMTGQPGRAGSASAISTGGGERSRLTLIALRAPGVHKASTGRTARPQRLLTSYPHLFRVPHI